VRVCRNPRRPVSRWSGPCPSPSAYGAERGTPRGDRGGGGLGTSFVGTRILPLFPRAHVFGAGAKISETGEAEALEVHHIQTDRTGMILNRCKLRGGESGSSLFLPKTAVFRKWDARKTVGGRCLAARQTTQKFKKNSAESRLHVRPAPRHNLRGLLVAALPEPVTFLSIELFFSFFVRLCDERVRLLTTVSTVSIASGLTRPGKNGMSDFRPSLFFFSRSSPHSFIRPAFWGTFLFPPFPPQTEVHGGCAESGSLDDRRGFDL